jgi:hypothetical protein
MLRGMANEKGTNNSGAAEKGSKPRRTKGLGPATIARPALFGAAVLTLVKVATKG